MKKLAEANKEAALKESATSEPQVAKDDVNVVA